MATKGRVRLLVLGVAGALALGCAMTILAAKPPSGGGGMPDPVNVRVSVPTVFSVKLEWQSGSGKTRGYKVAYSDSSSIPDLSTAVDVGNVTLYWVSFIAPGTPYKFRVWAYDGKGNTSSGVTVPGSTLPIPANCLAYDAQHGVTEFGRVAYDSANNRIYGVGILGSPSFLGWSVGARDASDLSPVAEFGVDGAVTMFDVGYAISVAVDSSGNVYASGVGSPDGGLTTGFMIQKRDPAGGEVWTATGPTDYECTEVRINMEGGVEYVYGLGVYVPGGQPLLLAKLYAETGAPVPGFLFEPGNPGYTNGGNAENMAIGSDGIYVTWSDEVLNSAVVSKFGFGGESLWNVPTGSARGQGIATGYWQEQEWVWVGFPNEIRRFDTNLVEAPDSEAGLGCHKVNPSPYTDYLLSLRVVNDGTRTLRFLKTAPVVCLTWPITFLIGAATTPFSQSSSTRTSMSSLAGEPAPFLLQARISPRSSNSAVSDRSLGPPLGHGRRNRRRRPDRKAWGALGPPLGCCPERAVVGTGHATRYWAITHRPADRPDRGGSLCSPLDRPWGNLT